MDHQLKPPKYHSFFIYILSSLYSVSFYAPNVLSNSLLNFRLISSRNIQLCSATSIYSLRPKPVSGASIDCSGTTRDSARIVD